ncbi:conserved hypothetical protein [Mesorhizobium escarrei]|uniref:Uncharacterized protein n=1 Tax=Mesorhizobium escarrei TaxID=666018 RepID=A0ABM9DY07_9HYPH|nr:conserved hypothetical protein [Mesorhizobium escarrei]
MPFVAGQSLQGWNSLQIVEVGAAPIALPGTSPHTATEKGAGRNVGALLAAPAIGETGDDSALSPSLYSHYTGRGCRQAGEGRRRLPKRMTRRSQRAFECRPSILTT